jgi:hypothetical protein
MRARRFTIADVMILVPAAALGSLFLRAYLPGMYQQMAFLPTLFPDPWGVWAAVFWLHGPGSCFVVPVMAAMIVIRLRRPRPRLIRFQPGFVACVAVLVSLLPGFAWIATIYHRPGFRRAQGFQQAWSITTDWSETAVIGAWTALYLSKKWRAEPSWIDRTGRALGLFWVLLFVAQNGIMWAQRIWELLMGMGS